MNILFLLIPLSLVLLSLAIWAFFWAVKNNQFEDLEGPAYSILFDDDEPKANKAEKTTNQESEIKESETKETPTKEPSEK
ncbi:cbb3-type cytochrome oxidase assembly protein CcoS [Marinospirillum insulare]|uniref:Cytochrome oxidase maturation protein, cbb3-type n=1 Tax=Marinospirillum insulare TaxID=217169 RepID=A0ABQ5ZU97_9GAMM|nr:cbb3-type cytochrome oxidase assembly protein CcoS [Marinospirillum insulare]GLR62987.1 hypothetical protein GCM10007878_04220 [Marinospirillum insulare]